MHTEKFEAVHDGHTFKVKAVLFVPAGLSNDELHRGLYARWAAK